MVLFICCRDAEDSAIGATSLQALSSRVLHPLSAQACNRCASPRPVMMSNAVRACARCCRRLARQSWRLLRCLHSKATLRSLMLLCGRKHECINIECTSRGLVSFFIFLSRFKLNQKCAYLAPLSRKCSRMCTGTSTSFLHMRDRRFLK